MTATTARIVGLDTAGIRTLHAEADGTGPTRQCRRAHTNTTNR